MAAPQARIAALDPELMIEVDNLHKAYGDLPVVRGVDLQVRRGERIVAMEFDEPERPRLAGE